MKHHPPFVISITDPVLCLLILFHNSLVSLILKSITLIFCFFLQKKTTKNVARLFSILTLIKSLSIKSGENNKIPECSCAYSNVSYLIQYYLIEIP